jgi:hypothetical protein
MIGKSIGKVRVVLKEAKVMPSKKQQRRLEAERRKNGALSSLGLSEMTGVVLVNPEGEDARKEGYFSREAGFQTILQGKK